MADVQNELVIESLKKIQAKLADHDRNDAEIKQGISRIERQVHELRGDRLRHAEHLAMLELKVERIETRLELRNA